MDEAATEQYRKALLRLKAELQRLGETAREGAGTVELDQTRVGRLSRMDALQSQQMALETARRRRQQLARIEGALRRTESGDFGYCFVCGEAIDALRLGIDPTVSRCMGCVDK
jgi:DnaK suppressor protein